MLINFNGCEMSLRKTVATFYLVLSAVSFALPSIATAQSSLPSPASGSELKASTPDVFRSALEGYKNHTEEKIVSWKEANDMTARVGGWRAYAKEASGAEAVPAEPAAANVKAKP
jgi:hypothetical protein